MYILITEDNAIHKTEKITAEDKSACDDGYLTIINAYDYTEYYQGKWTDIPTWVNVEE